MKNKYSIGDLVWDKASDVYGIIVAMKENPALDSRFRWAYYMRWSDQLGETFEYENEIEEHPDKNLLMTTPIPF